jgi:prophage regulatory protein
MTSPATITLNDAALSQIAEALAPHIERLLDERLSRRDTALGGGPRLLRWRAVSQLTGMGRSSIYRDETFPKPVKIGERMVAWREDEIRDWINRRISRQETTPS